MQNCSFSAWSSSAHSAPILSRRESIDDLVYALKVGVDVRRIHPINLLDASNCDFNAAPTVANFSLSSIEGDWFELYGKDNSESDFTPDEGPSDTRETMSQDVSKSDTAKFRTCHLQGPSPQIEVCMVYIATISAVGVLTDHISALMTPSFNTMYPNSRYSGTQTRILTVDDDFYVSQSCDFSNGECPKQRLSLTVSSRGEP